MFWFEGFGFVTFQSEDDADSACEEQFHVINDKKVIRNKFLSHGR